MSVFNRFTSRTVANIQVDIFDEIELDVPEHDKLAINVLLDSFKRLSADEMLRFPKVLERVLHEVNRTYTFDRRFWHVSDKDISKCMACVVPASKFLRLELDGICREALVLVRTFAPPEASDAMLSLLRSINEQCPRLTNEECPPPRRSPLWYMLSEVARYFTEVPDQRAESDLLRAWMFLDDLRRKDDKYWEKTGNGPLIQLDLALLGFAEKFHNLTLVVALLNPLWTPIFRDYEDPFNKLVRSLSRELKDPVFLATLPESQQQCLLGLLERLQPS